MLEEQKILDNLTSYVGELHKRSNTIVEHREKRRRDSIQMSGGRSSVAKQKRMRLIAQAAFEGEGDDSFGANDEDWDVYLNMVCWI